MATLIYKQTKIPILDYGGFYLAKASVDDLQKLQNKDCKLNQFQGSASKNTKIYNKSYEPKKYIIEPIGKRRTIDFQ